MIHLKLDFNYQGEKKKVPCDTHGISGLFYKFISINELETFDFDEISGNETLNLFTTPEEQEKPEDNTNTQVVQLDGDTIFKYYSAYNNTTRP